MPACEKHRKLPIKGYSSCAACEIEMLREDVEKLELLKREFKNFIAASMTVRIVNQADWMKWFEMRLNEYLEFLGDSDRVAFDGDGFKIIREEE